MAYQHPYSISPHTITLIAEISEAIGRLTVMAELEDGLKLRKVNRIRTIQGSLAIEGNTLSEAQITAILDGKAVIAPPKEIQEVRNAMKAYEAFKDWQPSREKDVLYAHRILMAGLIDDAGQYRRGGVGVMAGDQIIHMAPPANRVGVLMQDLLNWLSTSEEHPLIQSSIFHYEFEFIHPFADGNGRMGWLWQTLILSRWNPIFANVPLESLVYQHQQAYYDALQASTDQTDCAPFIRFMLQMILDAVQGMEAGDPGENQVTDQVTDQVSRLLAAIGKQALSAQELMQRLELLHRPTFQKNYLNPALQAGLVERTQPDSPKSPTQRYRLTGKGRVLNHLHDGE